MPRLTNKQRRAVRYLTQSALASQLSFRVAFQAADYLHNDARENWRDFLDRLHTGYPVKGVGIKAMPSNLKAFDADDGGFLHLEEDLNPEDASSELLSFPYQAASAAYSFTLLEGYGNDLADIVNPGYIAGRRAWHHGVHGDADLKDPTQLKKAKEGFTKPFNRAAPEVKNYTVQRLVSLKRDRNAFMHDAKVGVDFQKFHGMVMGTIAALHFLVIPTEKQLSVYPYFDYHAKWK
ncbi:hypothetical protein [Comamonas sp.]|uniref:hypothetical protein n=1 Tax=Comamonas sp. TaxID=34028 RepID=UPI003D097253